MPRPFINRVVLPCAALLLVTIAQAQADALCSRDEVLQTVTQQMRNRNHYAEIDRTSILEWPTDDPNTVRCTALAAVRTPYAPSGAGGVSYREAYRFSVTVTGHRFTVIFAE